jgi:hypothetical protein
MTALFVEDFRLGLDLRKSILTASPGSLQVLDNCVVTPGGEIVKRKAFVPVATMPSGVTHGLHGNEAGPATNPSQLYVFAMSGTPGANTDIATITFTNGAPSIPVFEQSLALPVGGDSGFNFADAAAYGQNQLFVAGTTTLSGLQNWWLGEVVGGYQGIAPFVSAQKMYRLSGSVLYFSGVGDPSVIDPLDPAGDGPNTVNPGAGFIDMSHVDENGQNLIGMQAYYKEVAIFSRRCCLLFSLDPDLANNTFEQVIHIGALSNDTILQFGTGDVLFLSDSGVRSLRVINISLAAGVTDVGSPIDSLIQAAIIANPVIASNNSRAIIEPNTGRYWLAIGSTIYVLSYWPSAKINAWSTFTLPFNVDFMAVAGNTVFIRSGEIIYAYGGLDQNTYDNSVATVVTPFMAGDTPTVEKTFFSISAMLQGNWAVSCGCETGNTTFYDLAANLSGDTYSQQRIGYSAKGTHISFKLTSSDAGPSLVGALSAQYREGREL